MKTFVILLRGINVSGKNIIKMADLKRALITAGFKNVNTYIQSGNILLQSSKLKPAIEEEIKQLIKEHFFLDITVFCLDVHEIETALQNNPFPTDAPNNKVFFTFMKNTATQTAVSAIQQIDFRGDQFKIINNVLYFYLVNGMSDSKMSNNFFEKKLQTAATGRNLNTIHKLISLAKTI